MGSFLLIRLYSVTLHIVQHIGQIIDVITFSAGGRVDDPLAVDLYHVYRYLVGILAVLAGNREFQIYLVTGGDLYVIHLVCQFFHNGGALLRVQIGVVFIIQPVRDRFISIFVIQICFAEQFCKIFPAVFDIIEFLIREFVGIFPLDRDLPALAVLVFQFVP